MKSSVNFDDNFVCVAKGPNYPICRTFLPLVPRWSEILNT